MYIYICIYIYTRINMCGSNRINTFLWPHLRSATVGLVRMPQKGDKVQVAGSGFEICGRPEKDDDFLFVEGHWSFNSAFLRGRKRM